MWLPAPARWTRRVSGPAPAASSRARRERSGPRKVRYFDFTVITDPPSFTRSMEGVREFGPGLKGWSRPRPSGSWAGRSSLDSRTRNASIYVGGEGTGGRHIVLIATALVLTLPLFLPLFAP